MVKYIALLVFCLSVLSSCAGLNVDFNTGKCSYWRIGDQKLMGIKIDKKGNDFTGELGSQVSKGKAGDALMLIQSILKAME